MQSVIIIAPRGIGIDELIARVPADYRVETQSRDRTLLWRGASYAALNRETRAGMGYDPDELGSVLEEIEDPEFISLEFNDYNLVIALLPFIADDDRLIVDNNYGTLLRGPEFLALLRERPDWDWRLDR